ncbi:F-box only protein 15 [Discoglossus pictus]
MATGRGWLHQQYNILKQREKSGIMTTKSINASRLVSSKCTASGNLRNLKPLRVGKSTSHSHNSYIVSIPSEILMKIFSYLDPVSLLCVGIVNKRFYELSKDNLIWYNIYFSVRSWKPKSVDSLADRLHSATIEEKPPGFWRKTYIAQTISSRKNKMSQILKSVNKYTGVPANIEKSVKMSGLIWAITLKDANGKEHVIEQMDIFFRDTSLTVMWRGVVWPSLDSMTTLQLHGVTPVIFDKCMLPSKNGPRRRSLIAEYPTRDLETSGVFFGQDKLIKLIYLDPGLLLGFWKNSSQIAFVMATLHYHELLEKSTFGSADSPYVIPAHVPILDDIDPQYGLHGYQLHIDLHSGSRTYMCGTFRGLFCKKDYIRNGFLRLTVIGLKNNKQHTLLAGKVGFFWKTDAFEGYVPNCFIMDITLLDETETPFWCVSAPVHMHLSKLSESLYDFMGQNYYLKYQDSVGKVAVDLVWMSDTEEYSIVNLVLYLSTDKVNNWFGTNY